MARLTSRGFTTVESDTFIARCSQPHTAQWKANAYRWESGSATLLMENIPIITGRLTLDSSDATRRRLSLSVGGGDALVPKTSGDPLVPFGQVIYVWVRIDLADGTWSKWLKMGEFPIISYVYERPSQIATVEAADYSVAVNEYRHLSKKGYANMTLRDAIVSMVNQALPNNVFEVDASDSAKSKKVTNYTAEAGLGRWEAATELAGVKGHETFFDSLGKLVIRNDVTDDNDVAIPGTGPDIGTNANPIATIRDGEGGNLVAMTATLTREGGCNGVVINLHETADQKNKKKRGDQRKNVIVKELQESGPTAWGDRFGRIPIVQERNVKTITDAVVNDQHQRAKRLLHRRRGVVRYIDLDAAGVYWLEPDDKVQIKWGTSTEDHFAQRVEFDLSGKSPIRVRTRQLAVKDPGA